MATEAQKRAAAKYKKKKTKSFLIELNIDTDADILSKLDSVENRQGYIKRMIREDINRNWHKN